MADMGEKIAGLARNRILAEYLAKGGTADAAMDVWQAGREFGAAEMIHGETHYGTDLKCPWCVAEHHHQQVVEPLRGTCKHCLQPIRWRPGPAYVAEADGTAICRRRDRTGRHELMPAQEGNG